MKHILPAALILFLMTITVNGQEGWTFGFGLENHTLNTTIVPIRVIYNDSDGFGFDFENREKVEIHRVDKPGTGYCTASVPFYFSVQVPEGNYRVKIRIGNPDLKSVTTVKAEARRLMVAGKKLKAGESLELQFNVSVRSPLISGKDSIRLKPREYSYMNWDNRLTLEFSGINQAVQQIEICSLENVLTLFLAGNSTVTDQDLEPWASWGQMINAYFNLDVVVANYAESGESLASFKNSGRLEKVLGQVRPGDYLFIEFGHNDQKRKGENIGPWDSYSELLREFATRARDKDAIPVFLTPTQRRSFGKRRSISPTHGDYPAAMISQGQELGVPVIDLNEMSRVLYEAWGPRQSKKAFVHYRAGTFPGQNEALEDNTHFNAFGAHEIALCVLKGIQDLDLPLGAYIVDYPVKYRPGNPNSPRKWKVPPSSRYARTSNEENLKQGNGPSPALKLFRNIHLY